MGQYARDTAVPAERSRAEIENTLRRYGATQFISGWDDERSAAWLGFSASGRQVRFVLPLPHRDEKRFTHRDVRAPTGRVKHMERKPPEVARAYEQAVRQCWRALCLVVKAKLEAVEAQITTFEQEFLAHIMLPDGSTFGQWAAPALEKVYAEGKMPAATFLALPAMGETSRSDE